jgi:hypothetical protein
VSDKRRIRILNEARGDEDAILSRVPCVGECIQYGTSHVRVLSVLHFEIGIFAAQVTTEDVGK